MRAFLWTKSERQLRLTLCVRAFASARSNVDRVQRTVHCSITLPRLFGGVHSHSPQPRHPLGPRLPRPPLAALRKAPLVQRLVSATLQGVPAASHPRMLPRRGVAGAQIPRHPSVANGRVNHHRQQRERASGGATQKRSKREDTVDQHCVFSFVDTCWDRKTPRARLLTSPLRPPNHFCVAR